MSRQIDIISTSAGIHHLEFGMDNNEVGDFCIQMWITKYGARAVDWMQSLSMGFITFMGGDLWLHNDENQRRCHLFGEQRDCIVGVVSNEDPTHIKLFDSLGVHSDGEWEVMSLTIPETLNYPNGMYSKIPKEIFKKRGGILRAKFLRNMKTTSDTASITEALNGEPLNGYVCYMLLRNTSNPTGEQVKLFEVEVNTSKVRV